MRPTTHAGHQSRASERMRRERPRRLDTWPISRDARLSPSRTPSRAMATRVLPRVVLASGAPGAHGARFAPRRPSAARRFARVAGLPRRVSPPPSPRSFPDSARPVRSRRSARPPAAVDENRTAATRARLDAIREEDEGDVEDPGERGGVDMFSGLNLTPEALAYWESQNAFFFPRLLLVSMTALGLAASIPQSLGGIFRGDDDAVSVLVTNVAFFALAAGFTAFDLKRRRIALARLQRELAIGDMRVIQRDKFRNERVFPLASLRQAARVALVYGDAEKVARDLAAATPFRRRLEQSRILVVPVVERGSRSSSRESAAADNLDPAAAVSDVGPGRWELLKDVVLAWPGAGAGRWLAWPTRNDAWAGYFRRLLESAGVADPASGGYVTVGVNGQVRGSGVGSPAWDVLLSTFPRNRPGNEADAAAESAWRAATVDGGTVEDGWRSTTRRSSREPRADASIHCITWNVAYSLSWAQLRTTLTGCSSWRTSTFSNCCKPTFPPTPGMRARLHCRWGRIAVFWESHRPDSINPCATPA